MPDYHPTSRRPIAEPFRRTALAAVRVCVCRGVHPDAISYLSVVAAGGAATCFWLAGRWPWLLLVGPLFCFVRLYFNMLDGMVALASGKASRRGEIVNELPDRASDLLIFAGVAHSGLIDPLLGYWAAIGAILTAYVGTLGQAVTGRRRFDGLMSKQHRMVVLGAGTWASYFWPGRVIGGMSVLDWTCAIVIAGCAQTIWVRLARTLGELKPRPVADTGTLASKAVGVDTGNAVDQSGGSP